MSTAVVLICADAEWQAARRLFSKQPLQRSRYGDFFVIQQSGWDCVFFQTGWGKIGASAGTQFAIDEFCPDLVVNLGTCGGFSGRVESGQIILAKETVVYDIYELMGDPQEHILSYSTQIDLEWLPDPLPLQARRAVLVSADRDLVANEIPDLIQRYNSEAGDWESGAIAWVAQRNGIRLLILRGVSDLVNETGSPAYGNEEYFVDAANKIMAELIGSLPEWLEMASRNPPSQDAY